MEQQYSMRKISLALSLLLLTGCAEFNSAFNRDSDRYIDPYAQSDLDELLGFGANMANIPASSRSEVCSILLKRQQDYPGTGILLHLMIGRLLSDACGDISGILDGLASIPPGSFDEKVQKLVTVDMEALKRINISTPVTKCSSLKRKQKTVKSVPEAKDSSGSNKDEARLLREKLEAIRSMEKHLDESDDGN